MYAGHTHSKQTTKGCVQGSIGGPIFWNLLLDPLLNGIDERGIYCQAFANDVVLVFSGETAREIQNSANPTLEYINNWGRNNKLKFAAHKTKAMILTNKLKHDTPQLTMGTENLDIVKDIKILGLTKDSKLTFSKNVSEVTVKALNIYKQIARAAKVSWGVNPEVTRTHLRRTGLEVTRQANAALAYVQEWGISKADIECLCSNTCIKVQNIYKQLLRAARVSRGLHPQVVKTIYTAVVEPIVLYAVVGWAPAAKNLGVRKRLNAIQRGFAHKMTKSYRTVSLNSALILAGNLELRILLIYKWEVPGASTGDDNSDIL
ncbi:jg7108 [Pararge aegeria aegeria]|uniref:Jg7108 protein n=1 Tax=Pararge aegeria aegeria TaxID=348720 RepID=A0A8S4QQ14_9NEOP|nr:jg7108 [Pararge aegeria aegeria]